MQQVEKVLPSQLIQAGRRLLDDPANWYHGKPLNDHANHACLVTSIDVAGCWDGAVRIVAHAAIMEVLDVRTLQEAYDWNDAPQRTLDEVRDVLDRTEKLLQSRGQ